ncbi:hypothetical protein H671_5g14302 [Cricetulus griseus]|nr:hypothetical protein H671_5g14302 [Cricetulus griseus]
MDKSHKYLEYFPQCSGEKNNGILKFKDKWMELEVNILSEKTCAGYNIMTLTAIQNTNYPLSTHGSEEKVTVYIKCLQRKSFCEFQKRMDLKENMNSLQRQTLIKEKKKHEKTDFQ